MNRYTHRYKSAAMITYIECILKELVLHSTIAPCYVDVFIPVLYARECMCICVYVIDE